jgi:hypothetical protein
MACGHTQPGNNLSSHARLESGRSILVEVQASFVVKPKTSGSALTSMMAHLVITCIVILYAGCGRDNGPMLPTGPSEHASKWIEVKDGQYPPSSLQIFLSQNYPNPFNPTTVILFTLPRNGVVSLTVYDGRGIEVVRLLDSRLTVAGVFEVRWNASNLGSGVYVFGLAYQEVDQGGRAIAGIVTMSKKMMLIK